MKQTLKSLVLASLLLVFAVGCSTSSVFRIPAGHTLRVTDRTVTLNADGEWKTSPFFWDTAGGAPYFLSNEQGTVVRTGKLKTQFRVASIFWPPFALIYWPMGLNKHGFDLTKAGDGYYVTDFTNETSAKAAPAAAPVEAAPVAPAAKPAKKKKH